MGLTQTKLHHKVLQENWGGILRRLQTDDGKRWVRTQNPCGDYPLHLACYGGHTPPIVLRALLAAFPEAIHRTNNLGYLPQDLARSNYREGHPFRDEVLEYLEAYSNNNTTTNTNATNSNERNATTDEIATSTTATHLPDNTYYVTSTICVVCLENNADHAVLPCGHLCLCGDCAQKVMIGRTSHNSNNGNANNAIAKINAKTDRYCPVGRCAITSIVQVQGQVCPVAA